MDIHPTLPTEGRCAFEANLQHLGDLAMKREAWTEKMDAAIADTFRATVQRLKFTRTAVNVYESLLHQARYIDRCIGYPEDAWAESYYTAEVGMSASEIDLMGGMDPFPQNHIPGIFPVPPHGPLLGPYPARGEGVVYLLHWTLGWETPEVVYVGYTTNARPRIKAHQKQKRGLFTGVSFIPCASPEDAFRLEGDLIFQHQPELNVRDRQSRRFCR